MADVVHPDLSTWRALFRSARPDREHLMDEADRARLAALPARVTIHRGFAHPEGMRGLAWTLDSERAEFFASDFATSSRLRLFGVPPPEGHGWRPWPSPANACSPTSTAAAKTR